MSDALIGSIVELFIIDLPAPVFFRATVVFFFGFGAAELDAVRLGLTRFCLALLRFAETVQIDDLCHRLLVKFTRL